jgi:acyl-CoA reductase-like NAD-dependent aldehyde dehydrogenase
MSISENQLSITLLEPIGVVAQIIPWNFPLLLSFWKIAPALAAGCTIVLKPAEHTPCAILEVARMASEAGLPDGVLNVVPGLGEVAGQALVEHPGVGKVAFTGSTEVGKIVMRTAAREIKRVSLELGGKAPCIVFDDADIGNALEATLRGGFFNQGENCTAVTRLLLHEDIYDKFLPPFIDRVKKIRIGDPTLDETELGSVISKEHFNNVSSYFEKGVSEGAEVLHGGGRPKELEKGYFFEPTVLADVDPKATVACEEIFGPIVAVIPFKTDEEAISIANDTVYGLAGGIWTENLTRAIRTAKAVNAGYLWVNTYGGIIPETPYGGFKQSGIGKELGSDGLEMYLEKKTVNIFTGDKIPSWYAG